MAFQEKVAQFIATIISIVRLLAFSRPVGNGPVKTHDNCIVLGNGPSLNLSLVLIDTLKNEFDVFCVNLFSTSIYFKQLKPQNYLLLDDAFLDDQHEMAKKAIYHLAQDTNWPLNLIVPLKFKKSKYFTESLGKNTFINVYYINYVIFESFDWLRFWIYKRNIGMPQCQNVLVALTFQCINMAYKNVYLLGADHSWHENIRLNDENELIFLDTHFYGERKLDTKLIGDKSYLAAQFLSLHKAFKGYEIIARYAKERGVKIFNAGAKSYIDVFEKIKFIDIGFKK